MIVHFPSTHLLHDFQYDLANGQLFMILPNGNVSTKIPLNLYPEPAYYSSACFNPATHPEMHEAAPGWSSVHAMALIEQATQGATVGS